MVYPLYPGPSRLRLRIAEFTLLLPHATDRRDPCIAKEWNTGYTETQLNYKKSKLERGISLSSYSQMLKGIMEGCILAIMEKQEVYGYELSQLLQQYGFPHISEGSIYPLLLRMQKDKWILGKMRSSPSGPKRKYYRLTPSGQEALREFRKNWQGLSLAVDRILNQS